eukprot:9183026-Pyramimonas_sp.AAC.1
MRELTHVDLVIAHRQLQDAAKEGVLARDRVVLRHTPLRHPLGVPSCRGPRLSLDVGTHPGG